MSLDLDAPRRLKERKNERSGKNFLELFLFDLRTWWKKKKVQRGDTFPFFRNSIKNIEGHLGTSVASFFVFIRWIFLVNISFSILWLSFVVIPTSVSFESTLYLKNYSWSFTNVISSNEIMGQTPMFYGGYPETIGSYRLAFAYIGIEIVCLLGCFVHIMVTVISVSTDSGSNAQLVVKVSCFSRDEKGYR